MTKIWLKAAAIRAVRSFAQGALASIGTGAVLTEINWLAALCTGVLAALVSVLMSLAGLPEAKPDIMSGAGESFDLNGEDRPRKCVASIAEIMELMNFDPSAPQSDDNGEAAEGDSVTADGSKVDTPPDTPDSGMAETAEVSDNDTAANAEVPDDAEDL